MRRVRNVFVLGVAVGLVVAVVRRLLAPPAPAPGPSPRPSRPAAAPGGAGTDGAPLHAAGDTIDPAARTSRPPAREAEPTVARAPAAEVDDTAAPGTAIEAAPTTALEAAPTHELETTWSPPVDGACPPGYPVKAKVTSRIFHVPGGLSYERTRPDRCYPSAEAAEADGFRPAKR